MSQAVNFQAQATPPQVEPDSIPQESAAEWSEKIGALCEKINAEKVPMTPRAEQDLKAAMLESMRALRLHLDRVGRERRLIAICAGGAVCPEGMEGCPVAGTRPASQCATCWESWAARKIGSQ